MNLKEKALRYAIDAHKGQVRKNEPDKPKIMHPINVGKILEENNFDEDVICAGILHDTIEDTDTSYEDLVFNFNKDIADLVMDASEKDKSKSWIERKKETIKECPNLSLRSKAIISADKIDNLEDLYIKFTKTSKRDFSLFNMGEEYQKWYYTSIYVALTQNEEDLPIFQRLKENLDNVFYPKENKLLEDIFSDNKDYYNELKKLHGMKLELEKLKRLTNINYVIEFSGTPRTGKTTTLNNLYDFFKKGKFKTKLIEEFTTSKYYKENLKEKLNKLNSYERNSLIIYYTYQDLLNNLDNDIILIDRSLNDRQIWNYRSYRKGFMTDQEYTDLKNQYKDISKELIDYLVITYADPKTSLKRDYLCSLALEERNFLNIQNILEYNNSLEDLKELFKESTDNFLLLDTNNKTITDTSLIVSNSIMPEIRKKYIKTFKKEYKI